MARQVFFSFKYEDIFKVMRVRNINQFSLANEFHDSAEYEKIMRETDTKIENWIEKQLKGASVLCVLIGKNTFDSKWVKYEIGRAFELKMGIFAIHINNLKDNNGNTTTEGQNPLKHWKVKDGDGFETIYKTYNPANLTINRADGWAYNVIKDNIGQWVESAAKQVGR
jgi:hypothetical protein